MAEIIQERIEDRLPELEQLERIGLFSHAEIKAIIKKASDLEYRIQRRALCKEDFINYVQYEINLLELIQRRRTRIGYSFKKEEIESSIVHRVQGVFRRASAKWKDDVQLWLSYVVFCKKWVSIWAAVSCSLFPSFRPFWVLLLCTPIAYRRLWVLENVPDVLIIESDFSEHSAKLSFSNFFYCEQVCLPLWISWAEWSEGARSQEDTEAVYKKAILAVMGADSAALKDKYLDWAYRSGGYKKARAVFKSLQESRPFSVGFFRKVIQFEKEQESCKMANLREYYERALREFGSVDSDLWMDYIKEELNHPHGRPENCGQIYWRALKMLQGESAEMFVAKHAMHQAGQL
ncbi:PREDICTED: U3 small nucleolar RNA-associated protein 6 homolog [Hipposideros armiger]|uniref:U3 small nucleolar RNA-associated protein 6 homolog n=1 Tax=Hipposideros armiger TaxID=186990 RepID=A0A8B7RN43_HIPAR|nr:PREDICTED: U3 small nucleolar RNA-associated protein 6 homolog [Hipposideros armiger]